MTSSVKFVLISAAACALAACGGTYRDSASPSTSSNADARQNPSAYGGGPRDDGRLPASPYNSVGGMNDDGMNQEYMPPGEAPRSEQPDAKASSTVKGAKPAPNGEMRR